MKILIVRHGETDYIERGLVQGWQNSTLNNAGRRQAEILAGKLNQYDIDLVICSDLQRAAQAANLICQNLKNPPKIIKSWLLRERFNGLLEGSPTPPDWNKINQNPEKFNVETFANLEARAKLFLESLKLIPFAPKIVLIVSHNGMINSIRQVLGGRDYAKIMHDEIIELDFDTGWKNEA